MALILLVAAMVVGCGDPAAAQGASIPADQQAFVELLSRYARRWEEAPNAVARDALRPQRKAELCRNPPIDVTAWLASVSRIGKAMGGDGALDVVLTDKISLKSYDIAWRSPLFAGLATLREGQKVRVSGNFFRSNLNDCLAQTNFTEIGGMLEPEFRFQFIAITPVQ
jgi:hypothetical protein